MISTTARKPKHRKVYEAERSERRGSIVSRERCEQVNRASHGPPLRFGPSGDSLAVAVICLPSVPRRDVRSGQCAAIEITPDGLRHRSTEAPPHQPSKGSAMTSYQTEMLRLAAHVRRRRSRCVCLYCSGAIFEALADPAWAIRDAVKREHRPVHPAEAGARPRSHGGDEGRRQIAPWRMTCHPEGRSEAKDRALRDCYTSAGMAP